MRATQVLGVRLIDLSMLVLFLAALSKYADLDSFARAVGTWALIPAWGRDILVPLVPATELAVALVWFTRLCPFAAVVSAVVMMVAFSAVFVLHLVFADAPECGCFGALWRFRQERSEATWLLVRNVSLVSALAGGALLLKTGHRCLRGSSAGATSRESGSAGRRGFTLVELILVLVLILLLVSMLLPALGGVRRSAYRLDALSDLRANVQGLHAYANDYDDQWPFLTDPDATYTVFRHPTGRAGPIVFFGVMEMWHWPLLGDVFPESARESFVAAGHRYSSGNRPMGVFSSYTYSATMYSRPEFWNLETRTGPSQWRPVRVSDVRFPSQKGALYFDEFDFKREADGAWVRTHRPVGLCDGSAASPRYDDISRPYPKGEGHWWGSFNGFGIRVMHTIDGVHGRDIP